MTAERLVIDASVVLTFLVDPGASAEVIAARVGAAQVHAPAHLPVEVTNVLRRMRNFGELTEAEALLALHELWALPIELWPQESVSERVWELGHNLTSYDASYVAIAEEIDATLLTVDARLSRAPGLRCVVDVFA